MSRTYLTTIELAARIKYDPRTIRERLKDSVLFEGRHYVRPFGRRKILYIWEAIERDMLAGSADHAAIPWRTERPAMSSIRTNNGKLFFDFRYRGAGIANTPS